MNPKKGTNVRKWDIVIVDRSYRVRRKDSKYAFMKGVINENDSGLDEGNWKFGFHEISKVIGNAKDNPELLDGFVSKDRLLKVMKDES